MGDAPAPVAHMQPCRAQQHPGQVTQQDYISQSSYVSPCSAPSAGAASCSSPPPAASRGCRGPRCAGAVLPRSPALQLQGQRPNICCIGSFLRAESAQHPAALAHPLLLFPADAAHTWVPVPWRLWRQRLHPSLKSYLGAVISGCSHEPHPPWALAGCTTGWQGAEQL